MPGRTDSDRTAKPVLVLNAHFLPSSYNWRNGQDNGRNPYRLDTYLHQARAAAAAGFDILFQADFSGVNRKRIASGPWSPPFEPFQLAAVTAAATDDIIIMPTVSTFRTHPVTATRALASLDRISGGRAAVNLVSSFRSGTAIGAKRSVDPSRRHAQTEEYLSVMRDLWASWPPEALVPDPATDRFVREDLIRDLRHTGEFYEQEGPLDLPPSSADFPPLMQAAGSLAGLRLSARVSDYVFAAAPTLAAAKRLRQLLQEETVTAGRAPGSVELVLGANVFVSDGGPKQPSVSLADEQLLELWRSLAQDVPSLALVDLKLDDPLPRLFPDGPKETLRLLGARASGLWELQQLPSQTVRDFLVAATVQGEHVIFRGKAEDVGREMRRWIEEGGTDGFQFIQGNDFTALCETIVPILRH